MALLKPSPYLSDTSRRRVLRAALALPAAAFMAGSPRAQSLFNRPVRMVVPFAAGGPTDTMTRAIAPAFSEALGQQIIVDNRPGAGGNIAAAFVAASPADGHTLLVAGQAILAINKPLYGKLAYDPERDFAWIGMQGILPNVLLANPEAIPAKNVQELIAIAREKSGQVSYGSNGIGSLSHLTAEVMASAAGVKFLHVPYQGAAPQRTDLLSGRIGFSLIAASTAVPLARSGKLRALAVSSGMRSPAMPEVPTLMESGFPMLDAPVWFAAVASAATPAPILAALRSAFNAAITTSAYAGEMDKQMGQSLQMSPEAAATMLARERRVWADAVRTTGATAS